MSAEEKLLGKQVEYPKHYCPEILVAVPRHLNREIYGIHQPEKLFCGYDSWHAYEASFLLNNGMPVVGILKIVYSAASPFIIESKSLKLYLGSFHMETLGNTRKEAIDRFSAIVKNDLATCLTTAINLHFYENLPSQRNFDFKEYEILETNIDPSSLHFSIYQEYPAFLQENIQKGGSLKVGSHLLKSNCKITNQPDWGSLYLYLKAEQLPAPAALLKYIVSLRNENHFHEEICEMTFKRLNDLFQPEILAITCLYTRRGGIDICPSRANRPEYLPQYLPLADCLTQGSFRQ